MIVLDTNVISELTRQSPADAVLEWLDALPSAEVATTAISAAEMLYGVGRLPPGRRRTALEQEVHALIHDDLAGRAHPFDLAAAEVYAIVVTDREKLGRPISVADAQIAAICRSHQAALATRNTSDFEGTGVALIDPWLSQ